MKSRMATCGNAAVSGPWRAHAVGRVDLLMPALEMPPWALQEQMIT